MTDAHRNTNEAVENKLKEQINKLENKNWSMSINHRTPYKPQVEYYDEQMVIINGVQYQRVEPPKPPTLYEVLCEKGGMYSSVCDTVCDIVRGWLIDHTIIETEDAEKVTFTIHKEQLQRPK
jgi:hypothetical protein